MKYIVKNCPSLGWSAKTFKKCKTSKYYSEMCENYDDCPLKQIIKTCKEDINHFNSDCGTNQYSMGRAIEAENVLNILEIEEIKE